MVVIKGDRSYSPSDSGCNGLARITHKVRHGEKLRCLNRVIPVLQLKVPVNRDPEWGSYFPTRNDTLSEQGFNIHPLGMNSGSSYKGDVSLCLASTYAPAKSSESLQWRCLVSHFTEEQVKG